MTRVVTASVVRNEDVADVLERVADLLDAQDENPYRVRGYRAGARALRPSEASFAELLERDGDEDQGTVVTERHGPLAGGRVVRGREAECAAQHRARKHGAPASNRAPRER